MKYFEEIKDILYKYQQTGELILNSGAVLLGRTPHIAQDSWLHCLFPPLVRNEIEILEKGMRRSIPTPYKEFLLHCGNGLSIFSDALSLDGLRRKEGRTSDEAIWQPFPLDIPNSIERPTNAKSEYFFIGGYGWDGSLLYLDGITNKVNYCAKKDATSLYEWSSFEEMLVSEVKRIKMHFDKEGKRIEKWLPTTPVA